MIGDFFTKPLQQSSLLPYSYKVLYYFPQGLLPYISYGVSILKIVSSGVLLLGLVLTRYTTLRDRVSVIR